MGGGNKRKEKKGKIRENWEKGRESGKNDDKRRRKGFGIHRKKKQNPFKGKI